MKQITISIYTKKELIEKSSNLKNRIKEQESKKLTNFGVYCLESDKNLLNKIENILKTDKDTYYVSNGFSKEFSIKEI